LQLKYFTKLRKNILIEMKRILLTGSLGQIGSELTKVLSKRFGAENVIISDLKDKYEGENKYEQLNITDKEALFRIIERNKIDTVYHLAALLSATGEKNPALCWDVNINGTINVLDAGIEYKLERIFIPSSIAVFGGDFPKENTPQHSNLNPSTMYGVTKVTGEVLCDYYVSKFGLDVRGLRYPGIISSDAMPGGGTTDYAVEIFYSAIKGKKFNCFLKPDATLPMMYMPDCLKATLDLMDADFDKLKHHSSFNLAAISFSPEELANEIKKHIPDFEIEYNPDFRQSIAESWPQSIDDSAARSEWGWKHTFELPELVADMIEKLRNKLI